MKNIILCMSGCMKPATYRYHNRISGLSGYFCLSCLGNIREDVTAKEWIELGFARKLNNS